MTHKTQNGKRGDKTNKQKHNEFIVSHTMVRSKYSRVSVGWFIIKIEEPNNRNNENFAYCYDILSQGQTAGERGKSTLEASQRLNAGNKVKEIRRAGEDDKG